MQNSVNKCCDELAGDARFAVLREITKFIINNFGAIRAKTRTITSLPCVQSAIRPLIHDATGSSDRTLPIDGTANSGVALYAPIADLLSSWLSSGNGQTSAG
jgi:hypothetical protein